MRRSQGELDELVVRPVREEDARALAAFRCSTGATFEDEVEGFVQTAALRSALSEGSTSRLLLVLNERRIVACAGHHPEGLLVDPGRLMLATRLQVVALSLEAQGRVLKDGRRLSAVVMETLIADVIETRESALITAIVARDNLRSIAVCERHGLRSQVRYDARHIRLSGRYGRHG